MKILLLDSGKGIIPFIKEILKQNKNNEYYLFMDHEGFPYGDKDELYLVNRLKYLLNEFNKLHIDLLLICCNTLSNIYLRNKIKTNYQIKTIFELNLANLHNNKILVTPSLKKFYINDNRFIACNLASSIENDNLTLSIQELKRLTFIKDKLILGCTHYPLIKDLFYKYLSFGLGFGIIIQALLNICVVIGLIPVTGVTLPFFSYGGSSLLVSMISIGIILSISKE